MECGDCTLLQRDNEQSDGECSFRVGLGGGIPIREATKKGYSVAQIGDSVSYAELGSETRRGRVGKQIAQTLDTTCKIGVVVRVGNTHPSGKGMNGTIWDSEEPGPSLTTNKGEGYKIAYQGNRNTKHRQTRTDEDSRQGEFESDDRHLARTAESLGGGGIVNKVWYEPKQCYISIRRLTPKECFRLQGWTDDYFEKASFVNFDSQLYKQAGNGVTVTVVKAIAERMD